MERLTSGSVLREISVLKDLTKLRSGLPLRVLLSLVFRSVEEDLTSPVVMRRSSDIMDRSDKDPGDDGE